MKVQQKKHIIIVNTTSTREVSFGSESGRGKSQPGTGGSASGKEKEKG